MTQSRARSAAIGLPAAGNYEIDPARSVIEFTTRHLFGLGRVRGSFALSEAAVEVTHPVERTASRAQIPVASVKTGNAGRDAAVKSPRLLDERSHPYITFRSDGLSHDAHGWEAAGHLTVGDVTRPVTVRVADVEVDGREVHVTGNAHIDRYEFGVTGMRGLASRHLEMRLRILARKSSSTSSSIQQHSAKEES
jgi:polyisoprenoid-binding protein YceI